MSYYLLTLHDPHDSGLGLKVAIGLDTLVGLLVLFFRLLELDLVDFDAVFLVREAWIERECVGFVYVTTLGVLLEWSQFGTGEGLKGSYELGVDWSKISLIRNTTLKLTSRSPKARHFPKKIGQEFGELDLNFEDHYQLT